MNKLKEFESLLNTDNKKFLLFDLEANTTENSQLKDMRIIQIGYLIFDSKLKVLETGSIYIKQEEDAPKLTNFIKELTGITQEEVDNGVYFKEGFEQFLKLYNQCGYMLSYGNYDMKQLYSDCNNLGIQYPFEEGNTWKSSKHFNIKDILAKKLNIRAKGMENLIKFLGLELKGKLHNGEEDCKNIFSTIKEVFGTRNNSNNISKLNTSNMKNSVKIDHISDLHVNFIYPKKIFGKIIKYPDVPGKYLLLGGDFCENINLIEGMLDELIKDNVYERIFIVWGNHDLRYHRNDLKNFGIKDSIQKYHFLNYKFHNYKGMIHVLDVEPFVSIENELSIFGSLSWYNYGIKNLDRIILEKHFFANFDDMYFGNSYFNDKNHIKFGDGINNNLEFSNYLYKKLERQLLEVNSNKKHSEYSKILLTHVKPSKNIDTSSEYYISYSKKEWINIIHEKNKGIDVIKKYKLELVYGGAFFVNSKTEHLLERFNFKYCIWGHSHSKGIAEEKGVHYFTNCYGYHGYSNVNNKIESFSINNSCENVSK